MKRLIAALLLAAVPTVVSTRQAPLYVIHQHPQLAAYTSTSQFPTIDHQCHWNQVQTTGLLGHVHIGLNGPLYAEINSPLTLAFTIKLFQWDGTFAGIAGRNVSNVIFDGPATYTNYNVSTKTMTTISTMPGTGTSTPPYVNGGPNPGDLIEELGHVTIDPSLDLGWGPWIPHGWVFTAVDAYAYTLDGTRVEVEADDAYYSTVDTTQPEILPAGENGILVGTHCTEYPSQGSQLGEEVSSFGGGMTYLPLLPISAPWPVGFLTYTYGPQNGQELANGFTEVSEDANIHMGIQGTQILSSLSPGTPANGGNLNGIDDIPPYPLYVLDPATITTGSHTLLARWEQPTGSGCFIATDGTGEQCPGPGTADFPGNEQAWALTMIPVSVGSAPPPPPPNPCVQNPLTITSPTFAALAALLNSNFTLASITFTMTATDTRGCTATTSGSGS